ncbi:MAG: xanthine dehydrogenase family protein subunit M [Desulfomicrobium sp.]
MRRFEHYNATSVSEAVKLLNESKGPAYIIAGGSDLMGCLKDNLWMEAPERVVNLKTVPGLKEICVTDGDLHLGALATLTEIEKSETVREQWPALAEAARRTASPLLRNIGTIAGNICQENRCWYYRYPDKIGGRIDCVRKGGTRCLAAAGDHRFHSVFGAVNKCIAVNPSDTAPALVALNAVVQTTKRDIPIETFFSAERRSGSVCLNRFA